MKEQGSEVIDEPPYKNPFKRFGEWLYYILRDIRHFFYERKMRKLKLGTVCLRFEKRVFRVLALDGFGELGIHEGNILSGFFHVLGKVKRRKE